MKVYEAPITIFQNRMEYNIRENIDGMIYEAVLKSDVHVDRDELLKALRYDRDQYAKGYADGKRDAERHGRYITDWLGDSSCSVCGEKYLDATKNYCPNCGAKMDLEGSNDK